MPTTPATITNGERLNPATDFGVVRAEVVEVGAEVVVEAGAEEDSEVGPLKGSLTAMGVGVPVGAVYGLTLYSVVPPGV